jgi:hypothetical protein
LSVRPTIASVPEDYEEAYLSSSPEPYAVPTGKELYEMSMETPLARREREMDDAARALQELHRSGAGRSSIQAKAGSKRGRANSVQDDVREMLTSHYHCGSAWPETMVHGRGSHKRVCCSTEASRAPRISALHPAVGGMGGPGMWDGILN